ncbi:hypothetical protein AB1L88_06435 [Tautonia sp. JC769]|uniref:hypothetical protein n=1 Tax=Tautonia sp. JC769 TaxID=3232135 RepID=UPI00345AFFF8
MPRPDDDDREIADAAFLFRDAPKSEPEPETEPEPEPSAPGDGTGSDAEASRPDDPALDLESYDLVDHHPADRPERRPPPIAPEDEPRIERSGAGSSRPEELTPAPVLQPWTRWAEWGPTIVRLSLALLALMALVYVSFSAEHLMRSFAIFGLGAGVVILLSYPIAITLERPVRMTPEHAVRDYFSAFSHHIPHHRRMWLLLSSAGRSAPEFGSYPAFQAYWKEQARSLKRKNGAGGFTPLSVRIDEFTADKSAGHEAVKASYRLSIFLRGQEDRSPLASSMVDTTLSRGPDRMWYLDEGRLPTR